MLAPQRRTDPLHRLAAGLTRVDDAEAALRLARDQPAEAAGLAEAVLAAALAAHDLEAAAVAERALGLAARELLDVAAASSHLRRAIELADTGGHAERAAEARLSLAVELTASGRAAAALMQLARAQRDLGDEHPQLHAQLALVYGRLGRFDEAHTACTRGIRIAERLGDTTRLALILMNRGLVDAYRGNLAAAERDQRRALDVCQRNGERFAALDAQHNLAWVLARRGRLPEALSLFDLAEAGLADHGAALAVCRVDRAEALLAAGLVDEARALARDAAGELLETGHQAELPEALLLQARAALLGGAPRDAAAAAHEAADLFAAQDRATWAAVARAVGVQARAAAGDDVVADARALTAELVERRLGDAEQDVRLAGGSADLLEPLARRRRSREARTRARAWQAELALRTMRGDHAGALRAAAAALTALDDLRAGLGATDLHASSAVHGAAITGAALELALAGGVRDVLRWSELTRATTLQHAPVRPPDDEALAADLERLRSVSAQRQQALLDGDPSAALHSQQLELEDAVRRRSRHARSARRSAALPTASEVRRRLDDRRLVSLFAVAGRLHALLGTSRSLRVQEVCSEAEVLTELRHLRLGMRRAVLGQDAEGAAMAASAARLDALLAPALSGAGPTVLVPTPGLAGLPWSLLPSLAAEDLELTPSLALWMRRSSPARSAGSRVAIAGPQLTQAEGEVADLSADDPTVRRLTGADATAANALAALDGAQLAHLACHGRFRADNPLFSSLLLADGPLLVYDIERLSSAPEHVVLSACDSARVGQDLLGLAAAFFSLGTRTLIASVVPVDDGHTRRLMRALHTHWRAGETPAAALRAAQFDHPGPSAAAFVCLTAGQTVSG